MYATYSMLEHWWDVVIVIIWGATAKLGAENELIQAKIKIAQHAGVHFSVCKACAEQLGIYEKLVDLRIDVPIGMMDWQIFSRMKKI